MWLLWLQQFPAYLFSRHDPKDFSCTHVDVLDEETAKSIRTFSGREKLTLIKRRSFCDRGQEIPVYVTVRKKNSAAKVWLWASAENLHTI